tara:strand:+ start:753 stop:1235 length:483 start_codon:yes stop_codon:yes gene_type:complete
MVNGKNDFKLTEVKDQDLGPMSRIHALCFDDGWTSAMMKRILAMPGAGGLVARVGWRWEIAGFVLQRVITEECEVLSLAVSPDWRGIGIGRFLLERARWVASDAGASRLLLEVAEDNCIARRLYVSAGFVPVGRRPGYYSRKDGSSAAALTMSRSLSSSQ